MANGARSGNTPIFSLSEQIILTVVQPMNLDLLKEKLQGVFKTLRGYGKLSESNVADAVRESLFSCCSFANGFIGGA